MRFEELVGAARKSLRIVGVNALVPQLEESANYLVELLTHNVELQVDILCESDAENFSQSLCVDRRVSGQLTYCYLTDHKARVMGGERSCGLIANMRAILPDKGASERLLSRLRIRQVNLRLPVNVVQADSRLWCCVVGSAGASVSSYFDVELVSTLKPDVLRLMEFYFSPSTGGRYLSAPKEELLQMGDPWGRNRGAYPRSCSYSNELVRYSVWGFVFNRRGDLLLRQRGTGAREERGLWDKSIGGYVDVNDSSSSITAKRELVEELFLPEAEFTKYTRADLGDIVHFGEWNVGKRPERSFVQAFDGLGASDWVMFRATDDIGCPLTVTRASGRPVNAGGGGPSTVQSVFRSDVFLFMAPPDLLESQDQLEALLKYSERTGGVQTHRLIRLEDLSHWMDDEARRGTERDVFANDMVFALGQYGGLLDGFSKFVAGASRDRVT